MAAELQSKYGVGLGTVEESILWENYIVKTECYGKLPQNEHQGAIHIGYGVDQNFIRGMGVAIVSILENNPLQKFVFHVCTSSIKADDAIRVAQITEKYSTMIYIYHIDDVCLGQLPTFEHLPLAIYYRIILAYFLAEKTKRLLYLDADIVCLGNLAELVAIDKADHVLCVVAEDHAARVEWLQLKQGQYFNSGMLYFDLEKWMQGNYSELVMQCLQKNRGKFTLPDQDALNVVMDEKVLFLAPKWNFFYDRGYTNNEIPADTVFLHYFGAIKPWEIICHHPMQKHYLKYEKLSPWGDLPLMEPISVSKMERYARELWQQRKFQQSIQWYTRYFVEKFL